MGAWGYGVHHNDSAADWRENFAKAQLKTILKTLNKKRDSYDHHRAAADALRVWISEQAEFLLSGVAINGRPPTKRDRLRILRQVGAEHRSAITLATERIDAIRADHKYIDGWREPEELRENLDAERATLQNMLPREYRTPDPLK